MAKLKPQKIDKLKGELRYTELKILFLASEPKYLWGTYKKSVPEQIGELEERRKEIIETLFENSIQKIRS